MPAPIWSRATSYRQICIPNDRLRKANPGAHREKPLPTACNHEELPEAGDDTVTYPELVAFCGNERQAYFLSKRLPYQYMSVAALEDKVIQIMVRVKERQDKEDRRLGRPKITLEYVNGERRDKRREMFK